MMACRKEGCAGLRVVEVGCRRVSGFCVWGLRGGVAADLRVSSREGTMVAQVMEVEC